MDTTIWWERQTARLESLISVNPKINLENHKRGYLICQAYLHKTNQKEFENILLSALSKVERYLKYNQKKLSIGDDYKDIFGNTSKIIIEKLSTFRGGSLFSTWAWGIMRYELLRYYAKKKRLRECELKENICFSDNQDPIRRLEEGEAIKAYFEILSKKERAVLKLIIFEDYTFEELSEKFKVKLEHLKQIYDCGIVKLKKELLRDFKSVRL